jgi:hypothetical protein
MFYWKPWKRNLVFLALFAGLLPSAAWRAAAHTNESEATATVLEGVKIREKRKLSFGKFMVGLEGGRVSSHGNVIDGDIFLIEIGSNGVFGIDLPEVEYMVQSSRTVVLKNSTGHQMEATLGDLKNFAKKTGNRIYGDIVVQYLLNVPKNSDPGEYVGTYNLTITY